MAADEDGYQDLVQHIFLAHDHFAHLLEDFLAHNVKALYALLELRCVFIQSDKGCHQVPFCSVWFGWCFLQLQQ